jgi:hypothetical protein
MAPLLERAQKIPGIHFCSRLGRPQGHSAAGRFRLIEKFIDVIRIRTRDLSICIHETTQEMLDIYLEILY